MQWLVLILMLLGLTATASGEEFAGPVTAEIVDVLDGDTFLADALVWPGQRIRIHVRIRGIDAPEMHARCGGERFAAEQARTALAALISGHPVEISHIGSAKYYGRVLADVSADGIGIADAMLSQKLVRAYGGGKRLGWCG